VGTAIILLSVSLPLVATQQPSPYKDLAVSVIGILVARWSGSRASHGSRGAGVASRRGV
jgi:hypothetical protein